MHLSTEEPATSRMMEPFGEVGGYVPEYFSTRTHFAKIEDKKLLRKIRSKTYQLEFNSVFQRYSEPVAQLVEC